MKLTLITATHYRAEILMQQALPSVLAQSSQNFEWVVVNDGCDRQTEEVVALAIAIAQFPIKCIKMEHPAEGFGLCYARNLGLSQATGDIVAYLDDDNTLSPNFVQSTLQLFQHNALIRCSMPRQHRRRDIVKDGFVKQGKPFISPSTSTTAEQLIRQQEIFDSNGFAHYRVDAPQWNPAYRVYADYEFLLQCVSLWGCNSFKLNPEVLVNYIQSSSGIIGSSCYQDWVRELKDIYSNHWQYSVMQNTVDWLLKLIQLYELKAQKCLGIPAFNAGDTHVF